MWSPNTSRPTLPAQGAQIEYPYTATTATATSGTAASAIDGINDNNRNTIWRSSGALPQSITLDLGASKPDVGMLDYVPEYAANVATTNGAITRSPGFIVSTSAPVSSTTPMNSCPMRRPDSLGSIDLYGQRSLPQIAARVTRTSASPLSTRPASGTFSTRTSPAAYMTVARISSISVLVSAVW